MRGRMTRRAEALVEDEELRAVLDLSFIKIGFVFAMLAFTVTKDLRSRFAIPSGSTEVSLSESEYERTCIVSVASNGDVCVNGVPETEDSVVSEVERQTNDSDRIVVFDASPKVPHGIARRIHLKLLSAGFTVLDEHTGASDAP